MTIASRRDRTETTAEATTTEFETVYSSGYQPDPTNALDVLAFVLTPAAAFANPNNPAEIDAVAELLGKAKVEAVERWFAMRCPAGLKRHS